MILQQFQKDELVKRAVEHQAADRLFQSYGYFEPMGDRADWYNQPGNDGEREGSWTDVDFAGCAIGCLATPVMTNAEFRAWYQEWKEGGSDRCPVLTYDAAAARLEDDFGIDKKLTRLAESVFESLGKDEALAWPEQFARALPVGVPFDLDTFLANAESVDADAEVAVYNGDREEGGQRVRDQLLSFFGHVSRHEAVPTA